MYMLTHLITFFLYPKYQEEQFLKVCALSTSQKKIKTRRDFFVRSFGMNFQVFKRKFSAKLKVMFLSLGERQSTGTALLFGSLLLEHEDECH